MAIDLEILNDLGVLSERYLPSLRIYQPVKIVEEFARTISIELDLLHEGRAFDLFRESFKEKEEIVIRKVYWKYSDSEVLAMQFIRGETVRDIVSREFDRGQARRIADLGVDYILSQISNHGFFNAGPHPGNFIITPDNRLAPVDFGMIGFIDKEKKEALFALFEALVRKDPNKIVQTFMRESFTFARGLPYDASLIGYVVAGFFGLWLMIGIIRSGRV